MDLNIRKMTNHPPSPEDKEYEGKKRRENIWTEVQRAQKKFLTA